MAYFLGIDIGGTGIKGAIVDTETGKFITERIRYLTPQPHNADIILDTIMNIVRDTGWKGKNIGCGFPSVVINGTSYTAINIDDCFLEFEVEDYFSKISNYKFHIINDADAAGVAEMKFGNGKGRMGTVVFLTLGTGIGSAVFRNGILLPNIELGQIMFKGMIAEKYTSNKTRKSLELDWKEWGIRLNEFLNHIEIILSPDLIILGGGVIKRFELFKNYLTLQRCELLPAFLLNNAGIIGAALNCDRQN